MRESSSVIKLMITEQNSKRDDQNLHTSFRAGELHQTPRLLAGFVSCSVSLDLDKACSTVQRVEGEQFCLECQEPCAHPARNMRSYHCGSMTCVSAARRSHRNVLADAGTGAER